MTVTYDEVVGGEVFAVTNSINISDLEESLIQICFRQKLVGSE